MSKQRTFSGLCIGGPRAGQMMECSAPTQVVPIIQDRVSIGAYSYDTPETQTIIGHIVYKYDEMHTPEGILGFWIVEGETMRSALLVMMSAYQAVAQR